MKSLCVVALAALFATSVMADEAKEPAKPDLAKGGTISATVCAACHTADGSRGIPTNPILQGQHADYIVKQLAEFKSGKRDNAIMKPMASTLSDDDMRNVAAFYASKTAKPGKSKTPATVALGEKIWRGGIAEKSVPACAGCHGPVGAGIPSQYARLGGQHAEYVSAELGLFRAGKRSNSPQMTAIAARMSDAEIAAVSDYVEGLNSGK
ncbi:c-type cytochrome [Scleromatobacter humisilvae]|uniref:Cytochrome c4 n=1 Tax=Scleromatobacter humisilvae TaxID=2897159 RepID=A0A9X1YIN1_9BURK|nr:c-type cytochrome [Scleromatobacter humisilvae]MCK9685408.1 cytochrome c4 [Scleromatobacter humisilvae]